MDTNKQAINKPKDLETKKVYIKPEIIHEMLLETRAGSTIPPVWSPPWESPNSVP